MDMGNIGIVWTLMLVSTAHNDQWGHGTTVTGTGAGNGSAVGKYKGVAYEADLVIVK